MEWQTRQPTSGQKRPNDVANHEFRARQSQRPAQLSVSHAEASGSSRMLTGTVGGDNVHGNVSHVTNYYNSDGKPGDPGSNDRDSYNYSSVLSDSEKEDLFKKLHFPQLDARLTNLRRPGRRTCEWLLRREDYRKWMGVDRKHHQAQDGLFWIRGNPGTGKSIAMKFLFQKMQSNLKRSRDELVLSFFFNSRGSDLEKSTLGLYRSLLFGLLSSDPSLLEVLDHCTRSQCLSIMSGEWDQEHERLLQELCENAVNLLAERQKRLYCYVDALDECPEDQIRDMVTYFEDVMAEGRSRNIRVCFSSRHYPRISIKTKLLITLEHETSHNDDIKTYIGSELRFDETTDQIEVDRLRDAIFQKSAGIFLWVSLVVRQLNDVFDHDGRMDAIWERLAEIPRAAKEMPVSRGDLPLYGLFRDVIMKDTRNISDLVRLTQLIFCAKRLLSPQEAFVVLKRSYHEPFDANKVNPDVLSKHILAVSKGLAEVTRAKKPTVQFIHETVREFLRDGGLAIIPERSENGDGNEVLKTSCLEQVKALDSVAEHSELLADYRTWARYRNKQDKDIVPSRRDGFQKEIGQKFPFLQYATQHVLCHANAAAAQGVPQGPFLNSFPSHIWVPVHNLFEKINMKRFSGSDTPILYILAGQGFTDLIGSSTDQGNYATLCKNEQCPTPLHNAIHSGHLNTARVLVGLHPKVRFQGLDDPRPSLYEWRKPLLRAILHAGDVDILRKVIQDHGPAFLQLQEEKTRNYVLEMCQSEAIIDCLAEHSILPGTGPAEQIAQADGDERVSPTSDLVFTRREIKKHANLLTDNVWNGQLMLHYAHQKRFLPLVGLYFELVSSQGLATDNDGLQWGAENGYLDIVKQAHLRGADLYYEDESGQTVLHRMFARDRFRKSSRQEQSDTCAILQYLLSSSPTLGFSADNEGHTAFDLSLNSLWGSGHLYRNDLENYMMALEAFVKAGAKTRTGFICGDHQYPWVVVPWISVKFSMQLTGETQFTQLNARDSLGRTALSWCFWNRSLVPPEYLGQFSFYDAAKEKGIELLNFPQVDVNSRDDSGRTILEHLVRHPVPYDKSIKELRFAFFKPGNLDVNLETSEGHSPLALIVSLYGTWTVEFGEIDKFWYVGGLGFISGVQKQRRFSESLLETARLLLATRRVDLSEQKRCLAKASDDLRGLILESIQEVEPDYLPFVDDTPYADDIPLMEYIPVADEGWTLMEDP